MARAPLLVWPFHFHGNAANLNVESCVALAENHETMESQQGEITLRDQQAESYVRNLQESTARGNYWLQAQTSIVLEALRLTRKHGIKLYDAGCGVGIYSLEIARKFPNIEISCIDFSLGSIKVLEREAEARGFRNITALVGNITDYRPEPETFDRAMCNEVLQHLPTREMRILALNNIHTSLKEGGIFVTTNYRWGGYIRPPTRKEDRTFSKNKLTRFAFTEMELRDLLQECDYRQVDCYGIIRLPARVRKLVPSHFAGFLEKSLHKYDLKSRDAQFVLAVGEK